MAKRASYSPLDYILGAASGALQGYGQDKDRRALEAEKAEERRVAQEEREYRRSQDALRNTLAFMEAGGVMGEAPRETRFVPDMEYIKENIAQTPDRFTGGLFDRMDAEAPGRPKDDLFGKKPIDIAMDSAVRERKLPVDPTQYMQVDLPGGQGGYLMTPQARREAESAATARTHRGKYDTIRQAYPQFSLPPYDPSLDLSIIESVAKQQADNRASASRERSLTPYQEYQIGRATAEDEESKADKIRQGRAYLESFSGVPPEEAGRFRAALASIQRQMPGEDIGLVAYNAMRSVGASVERDRARMLSTPRSTEATSRSFVAPGVTPAAGAAPTTPAAALGPQDIDRIVNEVILEMPRATDAQIEAEVRRRTGGR
jgi:hypothetical protein